MAVRQQFVSERLSQVHAPTQQPQQRQATRDAVTSPRDKFAFGKSDERRQGPRPTAPVFFGTERKLTANEFLNVLMAPVSRVMAEMQNKNMMRQTMQAQDAPLFNHLA